MTLFRTASHHPISQSHPMHPMHPINPSSSPDRGELWIGIVKLVKAALFLSLAVGAVSVLHKDVQEILAYRISQLGMDPDNQHLQFLMRQLGLATTKQVEFFSAASF